MLCSPEEHEREDGWFGLALVSIVANSRLFCPFSGKGTRSSTATTLTLILAVMWLLIPSGAMAHLGPHYSHHSGRTCTYR